MVTVASASRVSVRWSIGFGVPDRARRVSARQGAFNLDAAASGAARAGPARWGRLRPTPDREVPEAEREHLLGRVEVPSVDYDGLPQRGLDALEVRMPVLVPVRHDRERVRALQRL